MHEVSSSAPVVRLKQDVSVIGALPETSINQGAKIGVHFSLTVEVASE